MKRLEIDKAAVVVVGSVITAAYVDNAGDSERMNLYRDEAAVGSGKYYAKDSAGNSELIADAAAAALAPAFAPSVAEFFGMTAGVNNEGPDDYAATFPVSTGAAGQGIPFPRASFASGTVIAHPTPDSFILPANTAFKLRFGISIVEAGNLEVETSADGITWAEVPHSLVGRATPTSPIIGESVIQASDVPTYVRVVNAVGGLGALTAETAAGSGTHAHVGIISLERVK